MTPPPPPPSAKRHGALRCASRLNVVIFIMVLAFAAPVLGEGGIDLEDRLVDLKIERNDSGDLLLRVHTSQGDQLMTPEQFARAIDYEQEQMRQRGFLFVLFNITSWWGVLWVSVGFTGQLLFTFRMVLQWLASEKEHRSVVPVGFWWGSLLGGLMLLAYFIWRKDIVGTVGQSTGAIIYARNLWLIYMSPAPRRDA